MGLVNIYAALPFMTIGGLGLGAYNTLPYPMVGDSLDYLEWKTGERMEGICFSWNSFVTKFNNAVGALGVIVGLMVIGYVQPEMSGEYLPQTESVKDGMFALATLVPAIGFALSLIPMLFYDYTGKRKERILEELAERRAAKAAAAAANAVTEVTEEEAEPALTESVFACETETAYAGGAKYDGAAELPAADAVTADGASPDGAEKDAE